MCSSERTHAWRLGVTLKMEMYLAFSPFVLHGILSPCFYHVDNDVGPFSGLNY